MAPALNCSEIIQREYAVSLPVDPASAPRTGSTTYPKWPEDQETISSWELDTQFCPSKGLGKLTWVFWERKAVGEELSLVLSPRTVLGTADATFPPGTFLRTGTLHK